jgi:carboxymethylenebutenolidase
MSPAHPDGYFVMPAAGNGKAVLVLHAWWGLNDTIKAFCGRLADAGFVVFAPDLYHGTVVDSIAEAETLSGTLFADLDRAQSDVDSAVRFLKEHATHPADGVAVVGFSLGAFFAMDLSVTAPDDVHSVVIFYGTRPGDYGSVKAAYLGHFADDDAFEPRPGVDELEAALTRAGRPVTFHHYQGTGHWFFEADRTDAYHPAAASLAWERTLAFLTR